jgi:hypothetical protein
VLGRILIILALIFIALWLLRKAMGARKGSEPRADSNQDPRDSTALIQCAHCAVRLPQVDAIWREGRGYCSITHRNLGPKQPGK